MLRLIDTSPPSKKRKLFDLLRKTTNKFFNSIGMPFELRQKADNSSDMITLEQVVNLQHLVDQVIYFNVPGELIELGTYKGKSAMHIQSVIVRRGSNKKLHVYDQFNKGYDMDTDIRKSLLENFKNANLPPPIIHEGFFKETLPIQLPEQICFVHIDCGYGGNPITHKETILYCLENVYPLLSTGAVCLMMDYHDEKKTIKGINSNPGVKLACDEFLSDKQETIDVLYGNDFSHGFFRKL